MGASDTMDLDFTSEPEKGAGAPQPPARPATDIGAPRPGKGDNLIAYARGGVPRPAAAPDAPVLVVEDDEDVRRLLEKVLTQQGYPVRTAADGQQFVQAIRQRPMPCLVLLDVELPRLNG